MLVRRLAFSLCFLAIIHSSARHVGAQTHATGRIVGSVCDASGRPLDFANIVVLGTTMGAMARNGGKFEIDRVPIGQYKLKASFVGHKPQVRKAYVSANQTTAVSFCGELPKLPEARTIRKLPEPQTGDLRVVSDEGEAVSSLPLRQTRVRASVSGSSAEVLVEQVFHNPFEHAIESIYVFPLPHKAAVNRMEVRISDRILRAEIRKRQHAVQMYDDARREGRVAVLLEQERPNIFTQQVANIMPGHEIVVRIRYHEHLDYDAGYELVIPTVVGPRYIPGTPTRPTVTPASARGAPESESEAEQHERLAQRSGTGWSPDTDQVPDASRITPPVLAPGADSGHRIDIAVDLDAGIPLGNVESINHAVDVLRDGKQRAQIQLRPNDTIPNKDFVLRYTVADDRLRFGALAHCAADSELGYFTLILQPSAKPKTIDLPPLDLVLVFDVSGSMKGAPIETAKGVGRWILKRLRPQDRFSMIQFDSRPSHVQAPGQLATPRNVQEALRGLDGLRGGGGTEMLPAIQMALDVTRDPERRRIICMLTDAFVGNEAALMQTVHEDLGPKRLFVMGIGSSPNRFLVDGLAQEGRGANDYVSLDEDPRRAVDRFFARIENPVLEDIQIDWGRLEVQDVQPAEIPPLFHGRPLQIIGRYQRSGHDEITIRGKRGNESFRQRVRVRLPGTRTQNSELVTLWARERIRALARLVRNGNLEVAHEIQELGLQYALMTDYTAFIATDNQVVNPDGVPALVPQPVEMPLGVRHEGVFGRGGRGLHRGVAGMTQSITVTGGLASSPRASDVSSGSPVGESAEHSSLNSGVVKYAGELHVRGGRPAQVKDPIAAPIEVQGERKRVDVKASDTSFSAPKPSRDVPRPRAHVTLELVDEDVKRGAPVELRVTVKNVTSRAIQVPKKLALETGTFVVSVRFKSFTLNAPVVPAHWRRLDWASLPPGATRGYVIRLNGLNGYAFVREGTYEIEVVHMEGLEPTEPQRVWALRVR